jgi:hypothetical protein
VSKRKETAPFAKGLPNAVAHKGTVDVNARLSERPCKHLPHQRSLCHNTENDLDVLAVQIILPPSDLLVLQEHVEGEQEEEERQGGEDVP